MEFLYWGLSESGDYCRYTGDWGHAHLGGDYNKWWGVCLCVSDSKCLLWWLVSGLKGEILLWSCFQPELWAVIRRNASVDFMPLNEMLNVWLSKMKNEWILSHIILTTPALLHNQPGFSINYGCVHFKWTPSLPQSSQMASHRKVIIHFENGGRQKNYTPCYLFIYRFGFMWVIVPGLLKCFYLGSFRMTSVQPTQRKCCAVQSISSDSA